MIIFICLNENLDECDELPAYSGILLGTSVNNNILHQLLHQILVRGRISSGSSVGQVSIFPLASSLNLWNCILDKASALPLSPVDTHSVVILTFCLKHSRTIILIKTMQFLQLVELLFITLQSLSLSQCKSSLSFLKSLI